MRSGGSGRAMAVAAGDICIVVDRNELDLWYGRLVRYTRKSGKPNGVPVLSILTA